METIETNDGYSVNAANSEVVYFVENTKRRQSNSGRKLFKPLALARTAKKPNKNIINLFFSLYSFVNVNINSVIVVYLRHFKGLVQEGKKLAVSLISYFTR